MKVDAERNRMMRRMEKRERRKLETKKRGSKNPKKTQRQIQKSKKKSIWCKHRRKDRDREKRREKGIQRNYRENEETSPKFRNVRAQIQRALLKLQRLEGRQKSILIYHAWAGTLCGWLVPPSSYLWSIQILFNRI